MERHPVFADELNKFVGSTITKEMLFGRGYCRTEDGKVAEDLYPRIKDFGLSEDSSDSENDDDEINCRMVKDYISSELEAYVYDDDDEYWFKGIPAEPCDVNNQEVYQIICLGAKPKDDKLEITKVMVLARMVEQIGGGWFSIPGASTMESHFFEMEMVPPEPVQELEQLVKGRYIPQDFSLIGKPMPEDKEAFHPNPPYSLAKNSGWRNIYWHFSITVDEDTDIIKDIELSTYERETSMFQRPHMMDDDPADAFDGVLTIVDQYTDVEWSEISKS